MAVFAGETGSAVSEDSTPPMTTTATLSNPRHRTEPLPSHVEPMLAMLSEMPVIPEVYGFEYKWDGVRALAYWNGETLKLESRNLLDITVEYPELQQLAGALPKPVVLDGEIIALDEEGHVSFSALQQRMHVTDPSLVRRRAVEVPVVYMLFDVLYAEGQVTMDLPYPRRRAILEQLQLAGPFWQTPPWYSSGGRQLLEAAEAVRLEGIVAKRLDSFYEPGKRTGAWRKIKLVDRQEFVIGGWLPYLETHIDMVGSLLIGYHERDGSLRYAGRVGTGYTDKIRQDLATLLKERATDVSPFKDEVDKPGAFFVRPELVAEVEFRGWSPEGKLRQPSFKGLRFDKDPREVVREQ